MALINFCKFHGFGNDYIVIERGAIPSDVPLDKLAREICHRHTGVGSDGIAILGKLEDSDADFFCEIVNPDGSFAEFSGNGTRCAAAFLHYKNVWSRSVLRLKTRSGKKKFKLIEKPADGQYIFEAEIGKPKFASGDVPVKTGDERESVIDFDVAVGTRIFQISCVNVGNPVACIFVENFDLDWRAIGKQLETHEVFPARANIVFVKVLDTANIEIRIWERGVGETSSSGTCTSAAAVLSAFTGRTGRKVSVHTEGGTTGIDWREDGEILITGRAELAFCGEWPVNF